MKSIEREAEPLRRHKYVRVAEQLRGEIESGALRPGDQLPSFAQMLERHGIFQSTLERAYALLEAQGLVWREPSRGSFVAPAARRGTVGAIGLLGGSLAESHYGYEAELLAGIRHAAGEADVEVVLLHGKSSIGLEKLDGLLACQFNIDRIARKVPATMPAVSLVFASSLLASVTADDYSGARAAMEHLFDLGHRRIAFLSGGAQEWTDPASKLRLRAYRDALKAAGIRPAPRWVRPVFAPGDKRGEAYESVGHARMSQWLRDDWPELGCTALLAQNDEVAAGALRALREAGLGVPSQVSVIGFDGTATARFAVPALTTIEVPLREIGAGAVRALLRQIAAGHAPCTPAEIEAESTMLPVALQVRESTGRVSRVYR